MLRTLLLLWIAIAVAVFAICGFATLSWSRQRELADRRGVDSLRRQLLPFRGNIDAAIRRTEVELLRQIDSTRTASAGEAFNDSLAALKRSPFITHALAIDSDGRVVYPQRIDGMHAREQNALRDALQVLQELPPADVPKPQSSGWVAWYHNRGLMLGYRWQWAEGSQAMALLPRGRWLADVLTELPETTPANAASEHYAMRLCDASGQTIYQWGRSRMTADAWERASSAAELPLLPPLNFWQLQAVPSGPANGEATDANPAWPYWLSAGSLSGLLAVLGIVLSISLRNAASLAARRLSFVNQVSHELKTPLTNVLLYTDLLSRDIDELADGEQTDRLRGRLDTVRGESRRLQHLVDNVLQFARGQGCRIQLHPRPSVPDDAIREAVERMMPRLSLAGVEVELDLQAPASALIDHAAITQIVENLLSNVEKYASEGKSVTVASRQTSDRLSIEVRDCGGGIPASMREKIFEPFVRLDDRLESAAGTGIGLSIVRTLARLHGGDCTAHAADGGGASFRVELRAEPTSSR